MTPGMTKILSQAAAREDGNAQMFTKNAAQGASLRERGYTEFDPELRRMVITEAGRKYVASL